MVLVIPKSSLKVKPKLVNKMGPASDSGISRCVGLLMQAPSLLFLLITYVALVVGANLPFCVVCLIALLLCDLHMYKYILLTLMSVILDIILFQAISFYSKALNLRPGDPIILSNRSLAFCRSVSWQYFLHNPAQFSFVPYRYVCSGFTQWYGYHYHRISQLLRERSSADSEYQPLNGLDPTTHAEV